MRTLRMPLHTKAGMLGFNSLSAMLGAEIAPFSLTSSAFPARLPGRADKEFRDGHHSWMMYLPYFMNIITMSKLWMPLIRNSFSYGWAKEETASDWRVCLSRHLQVLAASIPERFLPDQVAELKWDCFYGGLPKQLKVMVAYLKATSDERTYSDYVHMV